MWRKKQLKGLFWNFAGANAKFEEEKEEEKKTIVGVKLAVIMIHTTHHYVEGSEIFQTPPQKMEFGGRTAPHVLLELHGPSAC